MTQDMFNKIKDNIVRCEQLNKSTCNIVYKALEKELAKKPEISLSMYSKQYKCPRCNNVIISKINREWIAGQFQKYCDECGQRIDWSDIK